MRRYGLPYAALSMTAPSDVTNMALFCDFENVALGVRDAKYAKFDIDKVLERLLLKGSIVVKKAYCDWERYKAFKAPMHEASFELIEIPHVRMSGKNSADIRMVVDALDLCYTKSHVDTFVIISGDSDFSPLVSQAAREQQDGDRRRREELDLRPADRELRRVHLLRRPRAREKKRAARAQRQVAAKPGTAARAPKRSRAPTRRRRGDRRRQRRSRRSPTTSKKQEALDLVARDGRGARRRARRGREDLGLDGQAGAQAPQARLQRDVLRLPLVQRLLEEAARGSSSSSATRNPAAISCALQRPRNHLTRRRRGCRVCATGLPEPCSRRCMRWRKAPRRS